jgi:hypothetical protein
MSLIFMSGWETMKSLDGWLWTSHNFTGASGAVATTRRGPSYSMYFAAANEYVRRTLPTSTDELYFQTCFFWSAAPAAGTILRVGKNANIYFTLDVDANYHLNIYTGDTSTLVATGKTIFQINCWYVIEIYFKRHASGEITVKIDGVQECTWSGDTTLSITTVNAVARLKFASGALGVDTIGTLPDFTTGGGTPAASTTHFREGSSSLYLDGSSYLKLADASLPAGFLLKNGDVTQLGTFMYWWKPAVYATTTTPYAIFSKWDLAGSNICFKHSTYSSKLRIDWATGTSGTTTEVQDTITVVGGNWYHIAFSFNGPGKRWDARIFDLYNRTVTAYTRSCTNALRSNCTAAYSLGLTGVGADGSGVSFIDDLFMFNSILPDWSQDCMRALYYDPLYVGQNLYTVFQNNWVLEIKSTSAGTYIDDVIVNDNTGSINNSWVDRAHIAVLKTIGPGSYSGFSLSETSAIAGADLVRRLPVTTVDAIYSNVAGSCHLFRVYDVPLNTLNVLAILETLNVWQTASAGVSYQLMVKAGSTVYTTSSLLPPRASSQEAFIYSAYNNQYPDLKFNIFETGTGSPLTLDELSTLEIGLKVI